MLWTNVALGDQPRALNKRFVADHRVWIWAWRPSIWGWLGPECYPDLWEEHLALEKRCWKPGSGPGWAQNAIRAYETNPWP